VNPLIRGLISTGIACALSTLLFRAGHRILVDITKSLASFMPETMATSLVLIAPFVIAGLVINHVLAAAYSRKDSSSNATYELDED
jgi:hypothetical protein